MPTRSVVDGRCVKWYAIIGSFHIVKPTCEVVGQKRNQSQCQQPEATQKLLKINNYATQKEKSSGHLCFDSLTVGQQSGLKVERCSLISVSTNAFAKSIWFLWKNVVISDKRKLCAESEGESHFLFLLNLFLFLDGMRFYLPYHCQSVSVYSGYSCRYVFAVRESRAQPKNNLIAIHICARLVFSCSLYIRW